MLVHIYSTHNVHASLTMLVHIYSTHNVHLRLTMLTHMEAYKVHSSSTIQYDLSNSTVINDFQ